MTTYHVKVTIEISKSRGSEPIAGRTHLRVLEADSREEALTQVAQAVEQMLEDAGTAARPAAEVTG